MARNGENMFPATIALGIKLLNLNMNVHINGFHCSFCHMHEVLLREAAKQQNITLSGTLRECQVCSIIKGRVKPISMTTGTR